MKNNVMKKKISVTAICIALIVLAAVAGVIAYLVSSAGPVENTFTAGKLLNDPLSFVVKEHEATDADKDGVFELDESKEVAENTYTVQPGVDLPKDPFAKTTEELKLDAYVFIEVVNGITSENMHFEVDSDNWTKLSDVTGPNDGDVYVLKANDGIVEAGSKLGPVTILKDNKVTVDDAEISDAQAQFSGELSFYGYMIQAEGLDDYSKAWSALTGQLK